MGIRSRELALGINSNNDGVNTSNLSNDINTSEPRPIGADDANVNNHVNTSENGVPVEIIAPKESVHPKKTIRKSIFSRNIAHNNNKSNSSSSTSNGSDTKGKKKRKQSILGAIFGYGAPQSPPSIPSSDDNKITNDKDNSLIPPPIEEEEKGNKNPDENSQVRLDNKDTSAALTTPALHATTPPSYSVPDLDLNINAFSSPSALADVIISSNNGDNDGEKGINTIDVSSPLSSNYTGAEDSPSNATQVSQETLSTLSTSRTNHRTSMIDGLSRMLGFKKRDAGLIQSPSNVDDIGNDTKAKESYPGGHVESGYISSSVSINSGMYSYDNASNITSTNKNTTGTNGPSRLMLNITDPHLLSPKDQIKTIKAKAQAETWQVKKQLALDEKQRKDEEEKRKVLERRFVMEERQKQKVEAEEIKRLKAIEIEAVKRKEFADRVTKKRQEEEYTEWNKRQDKYERIAEKTRKEEIRSKKLAERNEAKRKQIQEVERERQKQLRIKAKEEKEAEKIRLMSFEEKREKEEAAIAAAIAAEEERTRLEEERIRLEEETKIAEEAAILAEQERARQTKLALVEKIRLEKEALEEKVRLEKEALEEKVRLEKEVEETRRLRLELSSEANERGIMGREDAVATSIRAYYTPKISTDEANTLLIRLSKKFMNIKTREKRQKNFGRNWIKIHGLTSIITTTNDFRNIADAIDMAVYHSNVELARKTCERLKEIFLTKAASTIPPHENRDFSELLRFTSISKIHAFMTCFINEKYMIYNIIDLLLLLTEYSIDCMHQMVADQMIQTLLGVAMEAPERTKTDAAVKICKIISRIVQDSPPGKALMCEQENAAKLSQMILKAIGSDVWVESALKVLFHVSYKNKNILFILGKAGCVDASMQVMSTYTKKSKICALAIKCLITLTRSDENNATIAISPAKLPIFVSTLKDLSNNNKLVTQLLILLCAYGRSSEILRNVLGNSEMPSILIDLAIVPDQDPDLVTIIIQAAAYMIPLTATDIIGNITTLISMYEDNTSATKEQVENISLAKSVLGARFSGEKDLRGVKKKVVPDSDKTKNAKKEESEK